MSTAVLDDLKRIHQRDSADALGAVEGQWRQLGYKFNIDAQQINISSIVVAAMGGSAVAAEVLQTVCELPVPLQINRTYNAPSYVNASTLFIAVSQSGNTEETINALTQAEAAGATIIVIAAGGKLAQIADDKEYLFVQLPKERIARYTLPANLIALCYVLQSFGLIDGSVLRNLNGLQSFLQQAGDAWLPTVPTSKNYAKQLAQEMIGNSVVIYSGDILASAAYKWKISLNENAKAVAWTGWVPESNHNELTGWTEQPVQKPYRVIDLHSSFDDARVAQRFNLAERVLSGRRPHVISIEAAGDTKLAQVLWTCLLGDFVSIYTGLLANIDPTPLLYVDKFKNLLEEYNEQ